MEVEDIQAVVEEVNNMEIAVEEEAVDEMQEAFSNLETSESTNEKDWEQLLQSDRFDDVANKIKEQCIYRVAKLYAAAKNLDRVMGLLFISNEYFTKIPKARTAKIVRNILNIVSAVENTLDIQIRLCVDIIAWCKSEKRTFLRQRIEARLATHYLQKHQPLPALEIVDGLLSELKKLDDKQMLTEVHLTESRIYHSLQNFPKSKASLTASRSAANSIYVVPILQAEIDEMSGILHCEEGDHVTAFSYFLEAFDGYDQSKDPKALTCLMYMILAKVLSDNSSDVPGIIAGKMAAKYQAVELTAMSAIAKSAQKRSLEDFKKAVETYGEYFQNDDLIRHQLDSLYQKMLETNLIKIIHPYSVVEISHVAKLINLPEHQVERKLSQMILDKRIYGILDQGAGCLIINESLGNDKSFDRGMEIIANMSEVVDVLFARAKAVAKSST